MKFEREFFYDEVRDGFYIPGIMKRAWGAGLTILSEIDRICNQYDIPYYAAAGTLLGAVRNGQCIPWDDDIDIMMLRKDYDKFKEVLKDELAKELSFNTLEHRSIIIVFLQQYQHRVWMFIRDYFASTRNTRLWHQ